MELFNKTTQNNDNRTQPNWSLIIQLVTMIFLAGVAYASFESKAEALNTYESMRKYNAEMFMPRELSIERWKVNEKSLDEIKRQLDRIQTTLEKKSK